VELGGHLASITSQAENDKVAAVCATATCPECQGSPPHECWIGGAKDESDLSSGAWEWTDGTLVSFTNFDSLGQVVGVPDQPALGMWNPLSKHVAAEPGKWQFESLVVNQGLPAVCEVPVPMTYVLVDSAYQWQNAEDKCVELGGHLASITSQAENDKVAAVCATATCPECQGSPPHECWIGGAKDESDLSSGAWEWTDGTLVSFTNFDSLGQVVGVPDQPALGMWNPLSKHVAAEPGKWQFESLVVNQGLPAVCEVKAALRVA